MLVSLCRYVRTEVKTLNEICLNKVEIELIGFDINNHSKYCIVHYTKGRQGKAFIYSRSFYVACMLVS